MKKQTLYIVMIVMATVTITILSFVVNKAQTKFRTPALVHAQPSPLSKESAAPDALTLWKRLRDSGGSTGTPVNADVVITSFDKTGKKRREVKLTMQEGTGGQYRLSYTAPDAVNGRVVLFDGATLFQYEPTRKIVLKRPMQSDELALIDASGKITDSLIPIIEGTDTLLDRNVTKLVLHDRHGRTVRRCFVDDETGRSLRTEEYDLENGTLLRRVEKISFTPIQEQDASLFIPDFPTDARVLSSSTRRSTNLNTEKNTLGLPSVAGRYQLRTVLHPTKVASGSGPRTDAYHALYSNGAQTVSVFVTPLANSNNTLTTPSGTGWQPVEVNKGTKGYAREDERGRTGVVWLRDGKRYVLAARLPLNEALPIAHDIYKDF